MRLYVVEENRKEGANGSWVPYGAHTTIREAQTAAAGYRRQLREVGIKAKVRVAVYVREE